MVFFIYGEILFHRHLFLLSPSFVTYWPTIKIAMSKELILNIEICDNNPAKYSNLKTRFKLSWKV